MRIIQPSLRAERSNPEPRPGSGLLRRYGRNRLRRFRLSEAIQSHDPAADSHDREPTAAEVTCRRVDHREREGRGHGGVHGIPANPEDVESDGRRCGSRRRDGS